MQTHHTPKGRGLTTEEAKRRLEEIGSNELTPEEKMARSHRGRALRELLRLWPAFWEGYLQKRA